MTLAMETEMESARSEKEAQKPLREVLPLEVQHERLLMLTADLLLENQHLSCKVERLEGLLETSEHMLRSATEWAGMLF